MDALSDPEIRRVVFMTSSQIGKTTILENIIGYYIHHEPAPILVVQPTLAMAQSFSKDRLAPMIRDCPSLKGLIKDPRTRFAENTTLHKKFDGGHISIVGSNSPSSLASRPIKILLVDELDRFELSAGGEGDPLNLAIKRTTTFWDRKIFICSTPTIKGISRIEAEYELGDQRKFEVPCPECEEYQVLKWQNVIFDKENLEASHYCCEHCQARWNDSQRWQAIKKGHWQATKDFTGVASFHLSELYSSWTRLSDTVRNFLEAKKFPETLKVWINTALGESFEDKGEGIDTPLHERIEAYTYENVPEGVLVVCAGVDVQDTRLEVTFLGVGFDEEIWIIDHRIIHGDPSTNQLWEKLDQELSKSFHREDGKKLQLATACVDSGGHFTNQELSFCRSRFRRRILAIKGMAGSRPIFPKRASTNNSMRTPLFMIGVSSAKDVLFARLKIDQEGAGYIHFPKNLDDEYFLQLKSERVKTKYVKGIPTREYVKTRTRNEALDCLVYGYASFIGLNADLNKVKHRIDSQEENKVTQKKVMIQNNFVNSWDT